MEGSVSVSPWGDSLLPPQMVLYCSLKQSIYTIYINKRHLLFSPPEGATGTAVHCVDTTQI